MPEHAYHCIHIVSSSGVILGAVWPMEELLKHSEATVTIYRDTLPMNQLAHVLGWTGQF